MAYENYQRYRILQRRGAYMFHHKDVAQDLAKDFARFRWRIKDNDV